MTKGISKPDETWLILTEAVLELRAVRRRLKQFRAQIETKKPLGS